ncbi:MAG: hypothetical protein JWQ48_3775 [Conexibacter sp.]|jgi:hypothetical protein|nr:hypothetical protein [Conexibacter sp.]
MLALTLATAEHADKTAFYIGGGLLAVWAVALGFVGVTRPAFPQGTGGGRVVMLLSVLLTVAAIATTVLSD